YRYSITIFFPFTYPSSCSPCRNASRRADKATGVAPPKYPIRGIFPACCACVLAPHAMSTTTITKTPTHFRFWIWDFRLLDKKCGNRIQDRLIMLFSLNQKSAIKNQKLLNDLSRPIQHRRRNRQADLLCGFQVDDKLKLPWLFHRNVARLGTFQNLIYIDCGAAIQIGKAHAVTHKPSFFHSFSSGIYRRQPALGRMLYNLCLLRNSDGTRQDENCLSTLSGRGSKCSLDIVRTLYIKVLKRYSERSCGEFGLS